MNNNPKLTDDQLTPADFDKSIPEISPPLPETAENNEKLRQMDALVDSYIAECNAEIEKNAKNAEKKAQNWENTGTNGNNWENTENNGKIREQMGNNGNTKEQKGQKSTSTKNANSVHSWCFDGEVIRTVLRFSLLKNLEIYGHFKISKNKFSSQLRSAVPPEITKYIAQRLELNTPKELQEYYDNIPEQVKESVRLDGRIYRPIKPGIYIPPDVYWSAREMGRLGEVLAAARARAGR